MSKVNDLPEILRIPQVCEALGITHVTLIEYRNKGLIRSHRLGGKVFFLRSELIEDIRKLPKATKP